MNSDVLTIKKKSKTSNNRFHSYNPNKKMEIMRREQEKKERTKEKRDILFDESLSSRRCIEILYSLFFSLYKRVFYITYMDQISSTIKRERESKGFTFSSSFITKRTMKVFT